jgi:4-amino-4-deoxy-L-arabinose transferase-like glycosyltransferase
VQKIRQHPILILLTVNLLVGIFTFRNYGLSWDEPLFYDYANALPYAYSPKEWFSGNFNLEKAYGISGTDHANRGPAYIILARPVVLAIESLGADNASAWHLVNFLTFQLGVYLLYRLAKRWMSPTAALASAALFAWQPLLWGHAFINPKDPPFLVFFLGAVCFGLEMIDKVEKLHREEAKNMKLIKGFWKSLGPILLSAFFLGIATSIRVLGPLAGLLVGIYALTRFNTDILKRLAIYGILALLVAFVAWPYLWTNPLQKFIEVFGFMSDNPTQLQVLFNGQLYRADELPRRYLPLLLGLTLTEPVFPLFLIGLPLAFWKKLKTIHADNWSLITDYFLLLLWFLIPFAYVILRKPPMYDGYRHFLFILPPLFIFAGFAFEKLFEFVKSRWVVAALTLLLFTPGIYGFIQLHPYEYAYYNSLAGGTGGAFRTYETDYWLTCYKEAVEQFKERDAQLFIKREPYIAEYYANDNITIRDYRTEFGNIQSSDFVLVNTRANEDLKTFKDAPVVLQIRRGDAIFCEIKQIP